MSAPAPQNIEELSVRVVDRNSKTAEGSVRVQRWGKKERSRRALKMLGLCWLGAIIAVPIPLVHLVAVPGLLLAGIFLSLRISGQQSIVLGGKSTCPTCGEPLDIVRGPDTWPLSEMCAKCQSMVTIEKLAGSNAAEPAPSH